MKYLQINFIKEGQSPCTLNYKTLLKDTLEDLNKWKDIPLVVIYGLEDLYYDNTFPLHLQIQCNLYQNPGYLVLQKLTY